MGWSLHHPHGLIYHAPQYCHRGYTLFANLRGYDANIIDMEGRVCHRWHWPGGINYANLLPNGNLLFYTSAPSEPGPMTGIGGHSGGLVELDWDGNLVWQLENPWLHHDFQRLPNGNTLALMWEEMSSDTTFRVKGGFTTAEDPVQMLGDVVREFNPKGEVVHEWKSWEHLSFDEDIICPLEGRREWTHGNSINVTPEGNYLVSFRQTSTVGLVDRENGRFTWKWGPGEVSHQHNPSFLDNGHVLIFDNGSHRRAPNTNYSRIVEIDPANNDITWDYRGEPPISFYSYQISGAERQPNGNTLICEGATGRFIEVTPGHQIVWEYINPLMADSGRLAGGSISGRANAVFRAHRFAADDPALEGRDLDPTRYANLNRILGVS
ncbi:MAG: aryl sulfotransferase [SAR202 cluster bacterium]|nr:aryl sulfotransferase [SAR202 cluster bacterium]HCP24208.1 aryl sulfotransferase [Dehalococcoidia bacterium]|tara:strand:- start:7959 stop:9098 length:1140 start_codon:yes stop_codon:yes gene_type:complete